MRKSASGKGNVALAIIAAALGYFVDVYDIWLYSVLRVTSLKGLGFTDDAQIKQLGEMLLNFQMGGFVLGALFFGVISDRKGRLTVLFGSILLYSVANLMNGFVQGIPMYALCRFLAGAGLAGELGAGIALVSELVGKEHRGWATTLVATVGVAGSVAAAQFASLLDWRISYMVGGGMGLALLILRISVFESGMFEEVAQRADVKRGDFLSLFKTRERASRYLATIFCGAPVWFFAGFFMTFSPELQKALAIVNPAAPKDIIMAGAVGLTAGDILFGGISQLLKSRRKAFLCAYILMAITIAAIFTLAKTGSGFFWLIFIAGLGAGYWAVFVTTAGETFGTNLRGTVAITAPSFVRGMVIPLTMLRAVADPYLGPKNSTIALAVVMFAMAIWAVWRLPETHGTDLNFVEGDSPQPVPTEA